MTDRLESETLHCGYCDDTELVYELRSDRGPVRRCLPCLAIERGQPSAGWEAFQDYPDDLREGTFQSMRDWYIILARIRQDKPLVKRDPDEFGTVNEDIRTFLTNVMGADAHKRPSELKEATN